MCTQDLADSPPHDILFLERTTPWIIIAPLFYGLLGKKTLTINYDMSVFVGCILVSETLKY